MTVKEKELLVSILNYVAEQMEWNIDEEGFGYNPNDESDIDCAEVGLLEGLENLWEAIMYKESQPKEFVSLEECMTHLADKGHLCGGDTVEFIGSEIDDSTIVEVRVYDSSHCIIQSCKIL